MNITNPQHIRIQLTASGLFSISAMRQTWQVSEQGKCVRSLLHTLQHPRIHLVADPTEVASLWADLVGVTDDSTILQNLYVLFAQDFAPFAIPIPSLATLEKLRRAGSDEGHESGHESVAPSPWTWARHHRIQALIVHSAFKTEYRDSPIPILVPQALFQEQRETGMPIAERLLEQLADTKTNALLELILGEANDLSATFLIVMGVLIFDNWVWLFGAGMMDAQGGFSDLSLSEAEVPQADPQSDDPSDDPPPGGGGVRPVRLSPAGGGGDAIAVPIPSPHTDQATADDYSNVSSGSSGSGHPLPLPSSRSSGAIAGLEHHLQQFLAQNVPRLRQEFSAVADPVADRTNSTARSEGTLVWTHANFPGSAAISERAAIATWTAVNSIRDPQANPVDNDLANSLNNALANQLNNVLANQSNNSDGTQSGNFSGNDDPTGWINVEFQAGVRNIIQAAPSPRPSTVGQQTIAIASGSGETVIDRFGGVGPGSEPLPRIVAEVDTLKFSGQGMTAQTLQLTQQGRDLRITFESVADTTVVLKNFDLKDLDNLARTSGDGWDLGNILFDGDLAIADSFDVFNADEQSQTQVFKRNTTTFLNDFNNVVYGFDASNDTINGQGGNDTLFGLGGSDRLRGGDGNDVLAGGAGFNVLTGDAGADTFVIALDGQSRVTDFNPAEDRVGLPNGLRWDQLRIESASGINAGSTRIWANGLWRLELTGVSPSALTPQSFVTYGNAPWPIISSS